MSPLTFALLSAAALVIVAAWAIARIGAEHDRQMADFVEAMAKSTLDEIEAHRARLAAERKNNT